MHVIIISGLDSNIPQGNFKRQFRQCITTLVKVSLDNIIQSTQLTHSARMCSIAMQIGIYMVTTSIQSEVN